MVVDPAPIPADELQRTYEWVKSWGMLEETESPLQLVNMDVQKRAHAPVNRRAAPLRPLARLLHATS